jgi:hypothetical protein
VPDELIQRLFTAFAALKQRVVFKFDKVGVTKAGRIQSLCVSKKTRVLEKGHFWIGDLFDRMGPEPYMSRYRDDTSPYVTSPYVSSPYDTSPYVISRRFYIPVRFIPEVWGPYSGLG